MSTMDFHATAAALALALRNVERPSCCPLCLHNFAFSLEQDLGALDELRATGHDFWNACMGIVAAPRKDDDSSLAALENHFADMTDRCQTRVHFLHDFGPHGCRLDQGSRLYRTFFHSVFRCIWNALTYGDRAVSSLVTTHPQRGFNSKRRGLWPASIAELFPAGERETVSALVFWCTQLFSLHPLIIITELLLIARPIILPLLMCEPEHGRLVWSLVQFLDPVTSACPRPDPRGPCLWPGGQAPCELPDDWLLFPCIVKEEYRLGWTSRRDGYRVANKFLTFLRIGLDSGPDDGNNFTRGYEEALLHTFQRAAIKFHDDRSTGDMNIDALLDYVSGMQWRLGLPATALDNDFLRVRYASRIESYEDIEFSVATPIFAFLELQQKTRSCCGPDCALPMERNAAPGLPFSLCSRCKFTRYCSKACQKRDWKEHSTAGLKSTYSHKQLCPVFCRLLGQPGLSKEYKEVKDFEEAFFQPEVCIDDHDLDILLSIAMEADIPSIYKILVTRLVRAVLLL
ncbi:hypothetical protein EXIGLDRAFT_127368, partial [Exidia glandulosa HHB12029]